jgi:hypothetical protein
VYTVLDAGEVQSPTKVAPSDGASSDPAPPTVPEDGDTTPPPDSGGVPTISEAPIAIFTDLDGTMDMLRDVSTTNGTWGSPGPPTSFEYQWWRWTGNPSGDPWRIVEPIPGANQQQLIGVETMWWYRSCVRAINSAGASAWACSSWISGMYIDGVPPGNPDMDYPA